MYGGVARLLDQKFLKSEDGRVALRVAQLRGSIPPGTARTDLVVEIAGLATEEVRAAVRNEIKRVESEPNSILSMISPRSV